MNTEITPGEKKIPEPIRAQAREKVRLARPTNRDELWRWVKVVLGLKLPRQAVCPHHQTPLDYLEHVFFEQTEIPDVVVWACRGGGKTMIGAVATLLDMLFKPGTQIRILGGSEEQSAKMYAYLKHLAEEHCEDQLKGRMSRKGFSFRNGSRVEILAQSHTAVRGTRVQKMRCDEVELFDPEVWEAAQLTTRTISAKNTKSSKAHEGNGECSMTHDQSMTQSLNGSMTQSVSRGAVEVYSTMHRVNGLMSDLLSPANAGTRKVFAWCIWDVMRKCKFQCAGCILWDECQGRAHDADGFISVADAIAMKRRTSPRTWESEMLCFRPYAENQVFDTFSRSMHVRAFDLPAPGDSALSTQDSALRLESLIAGLDFGWRHFACVWLAMLRNHAGERVVWAIDEYLAEKLPLEQHTAAVKARQLEGKPLRPSVIYCDVAGRQHDAHTGISSEDQLRNAGLRVRSRPMAIEDGIGMINTLLTPKPTPSAGWGRMAPFKNQKSKIENVGAPRLFIHPRCEALIAAMESYRRDRKGKPIKDGEHDHILDALRYAIVGYDGKQAPLAAREY